MPRSGSRFSTVASTVASIVPASSTGSASEAGSGSRRSRSVASRSSTRRISVSGSRNQSVDQILCTSQPRPSRISWRSRSRSRADRLAVIGGPVALHGEQERSRIVGIAHREVNEEPRHAELRLGVIAGACERLSDGDLELAARWLSRDDFPGPELACLGKSKEATQHLDAAPRLLVKQNIRRRASS